MFKVFFFNWQIPSLVFISRQKVHIMAMECWPIGIPKFVNMLKDLIHFCIGTFLQIRVVFGLTYFILLNILMKLQNKEAM